MAKKQQKFVVSTSESGVYYASRIVQRISLALTVLFTFILWATMISIAHSQMFTNWLSVSNAITYPNQSQVTALYNGISTEQNHLMYMAVSFALITAIISVALLALPRFRKFEKSLVVDGLVMASFCFVVAIAHLSLYRFILARVGL